MAVVFGARVCIGDTGIVAIVVAELTAALTWSWTMAGSEQEPSLA
jgi:hypothetical protein